MSNRPNRPAPTSHGRRYKVYLLRPADRGLMAVVRAVVDLTRFAAAEAEFRMWEAYHHGRAVVLITHFERAELYALRWSDHAPVTVEFH